MKFKVFIPSDPNLPIEHEADLFGGIVCADTATFWTAQVGKTYSESEKSASEWCRELSAQTTMPPVIAGRFLFIEADRPSGRVRIWADKYCLLGAFWMRTRQGLLISNATDVVRQELQTSAVDERAFSDLMMFGYVIPPMTVYQNVEMVVGHLDFEFKSDVVCRVDWRFLWPKADRNLSSNLGNEIWSGLQKSVSQILEFWKPTCFRLSAGVDTRVIASMLNETSLDKLRLQVVCAPYLTEKTDRDVLGAQQVASSLGRPIEILHFKPEESAYFAEIEGAMGALSGLYGGEFLGGVAWHSDPSVSTNENEPPPGIANYLSFEQQEDSLLRFRRYVADFGVRTLLTSVYLGSFRSAIYRSQKYSWSHPSQMGNFALSPFAEENVMDLLLKIPTDELLGYRFYQKVVREYMPKALQAIPFSSPVIESFEGFRSFQMGYDPKYRLPVSESEVGPDDILKIREQNWKNALAPD